MERCTSIAESGQRVGKLMGMWDCLEKSYGWDPIRAMDAAKARFGGRRREVEVCAIAQSGQVFESNMLRRTGMRECLEKSWGWKLLDAMDAAEARFPSGFTPNPLTPNPAPKVP